MATENPTFDGNSSAILLVVYIVYESVRVVNWFWSSHYTGIILWNYNAYTWVIHPFKLELIEKGEGSGLPRL